MSKTRITPHVRPQSPLWRRVVIGGVMAFAATVSVVLILLRQAPAFYRAELSQSTAAQQSASDQCLANITATASQAQRPGVWRAEFTDEEINGWLAHDLPNNHPDLLRAAATAPRVALEEGLGRIAFEYQGVVKTYVSLEFDVEVRDERSFALRILALKGGALPLPLSAVVEPLTQVADALGQPVQWTEEEGVPVALVTMARWETEGVHVSLREVSIKDDRIVLVGESQRNTASSRSD